MLMVAAANRRSSNADTNGAARAAGSDPLRLGPRKFKTQTRGERGPSPRTRTVLHPHFGILTGRHLGTPRPMRSRVTTTGGRFPGSRVVAFDRLPRDNHPQWLLWPSARRLQLRGQLRNCIPVIAVGVRAPHSLGYPLARNHRKHARIEADMSQELRPPVNLEGF